MHLQALPLPAGLHLVMRQWQQAWEAGLHMQQAGRQQVVAVGLAACCRIQLLRGDTLYPRGGCLLEVEGCRRGAGTAYPPGSERLTATVSVRLA